MADIINSRGEDYHSTYEIINSTGRDYHIYDKNYSQGEIINSKGGNSTGGDNQFHRRR